MTKTLMAFIRSWPSPVDLHFITGKFTGGIYLSLFLLDLVNNNMDLLIELTNIIKVFNEDGIDYALCGGLALAVYAKPRATLDIDIMVQPDFLDKIKQRAEKLGFTVHAVPMNFKGGAVQIHRMTKFDDDHGEHLSLDLLIVTPETRLSWDSRITVEWEGGTLKVVSPKGLIELKSLRKSGQDEDDIRYLSGLINED
jgi:hypothetical protein